MADSLSSGAPVFLIGYRGVGKTTVARLLGEQLGWLSVDADDEVERLAGQTIAELFMSRGEPAFRDLEEQVVRDMSLRQRIVVALGGGAIIRPKNRALLRKHGRIVWLRASADTVWSRIQADSITSTRRPNLTASGGRSEIEELLRKREPIYRQCAHWTVETEGVGPERIATNIVQWLRRHELV